MKKLNTKGIGVIVGKRKRERERERESERTDHNIEYCKIRK